MIHCMATVPLSALSNPLHDLHQQAEAELQPYAQVEIVSTFGEPQAEYATIRKACGMMDLPQRGLLELSGKDRLAFLNNMVTNQVWDKQTKTGLAAGKGVYAFILNLKGRITTDMTVLEVGDRTLLEMDGRLVAPLKATLDKYLFAEQVKMIDRTKSLHQIALHGLKSAEVLAEAVESPVPELAALECAATKIFGIDIVVWRDDPTGVPGYTLVVPTESARTIWMNLLARFASPRDLGKRQLRPVGWAAFNATRIEAGRPLFGIDFDDSILPAETGLFERGVSVTKGCYLGQEIVARMHARGAVARKIVGLKLDSDALPIAGSKCYDTDSNEIGGITSSTISPLLSNKAICLALLKKPHFAVGTVVTVPAEGAMRTATVVETPFIAPPVKAE